MPDGASFLREIAGQRAALLDLLAELVAIPTHVTQPDGITRLGERMGRELEPLGFVRQVAVTGATAPRGAPAWAERVLSPDVAFDDLLEPYAWMRRGEVDGTLLVLGDLDSALPYLGDQCRVQVRGGRAIGPAIADMKGGLTVLVGALRALVRAAEPMPSLLVVLSCDEQAGSLRSAAVIAALAASASWALCLECARDGGRLMRSRAHIGVGLLSASGVEAHAGTARDEGVNAISVLARALVALDAEGVTTPEGSVTPTMLMAGRRRSVVPAAAEAVLDVRARDEDAWAGLAGRIGEAVGDDPRLRLNLFAHRPGLPATANTAWMLDRVTQAGIEVGVNVEAVDSMAAGSSSFVDSRRIPVLDGMGPAGGALMTANEYIEVDSLVTRSALLARTISMLGASRRS